MKNINWKTWPYWKRGATHGLLFAMIWPILFFSTTGGTLNKISNYFISTLFLCVLCICLGAISGIIVELENNFMSKRNLRYWIRGGIFASTIPLIILIILAVIGLFSAIMERLEILDYFCCLLSLLLCLSLELYLDQSIVKLEILTLRLPTIPNLDFRTSICL